MCCQKFSWKDALLGALVFFIVSFIAHNIESILTMSYYTNPAYFGLWSKLMMPGAGPPPLQFMLTSALLSFATGLVIATLYQMVKDELGPKYWSRVCGFALLVWILSLVFFGFTAYLLFNIPFGLLIIWSLDALLIYFLASLFIARK